MTSKLISHTGRTRRLAVAAISTVALVLGTGVAFAGTGSPAPGPALSPHETPAVTTTTVAALP